MLLLLFWFVIPVGNLLLLLPLLLSLRLLLSLLFWLVIPSAVSEPAFSRFSLMPSKILGLNTNQVVKGRPIGGGTNHQRHGSYHPR